MVKEADVARGLMKASVITPTRSRDESLVSLYSVFASQCHKDKELLIYDDSDRPSGYLQTLSDVRVKYLYSREKMTLGEKRDALIRASTGNVVVQFDDDDFYSPHYISHMLAHLSDVELVKLSAWFVFDQASRDYFYWDTSVVLPVHYRIRGGQSPKAVNMTGLLGNNMWAQKQLWGYGFSYVFRRELYERVQYDRGVNDGEDYDFVRRAMARAVRIGAVADRTGLALHSVHRASSSLAFPNYRLHGLCARVVCESGGESSMSAYVRAAPHLR